MIYKIVPSTRFKKDLKIALKRGYNMSLLNEVRAMEINIAIALTLIMHYFLEIKTF